jgi:hypothetical protein
MPHQSDIVEIILFRPKFKIWFDVVKVAGKAFKQIEAIVIIDNPFETFRQMLQRRSCHICIPHPMKRLMNVQQHICAHIMVQKHERVPRRDRDRKTQLIFWPHISAKIKILTVSHLRSPSFLIQNDQSYQHRFHTTRFCAYHLTPHPSFCRARGRRHCSRRRARGHSAARWWGMTSVGLGLSRPRLRLPQTGPV